MSDRGKNAVPDPLDRLEQAAEKVARRSEWESSNRIGLLRIHAFMGAVGGLQILAYGGPSNIENSVGVWTRAALGFLAVTGGLILALGLARRPRSIPLEAVGLALIGVWDFCMTAGLAWARFQQGQFAPSWLTEALDPSYIRPYPVTIYAGLFAMICVHLWTLRHKKRERAL